MYHINLYLLSFDFPDIIMPPSFPNRVTGSVAEKSDSTPAKPTDPNTISCRREHGCSSRREFLAQAAGLMLGARLPSIEEDLLTAQHNPHGYIIPETGEVNPAHDTTTSGNTPMQNPSGVQGVFLTFDDGPLPCTERILDTLARTGHKATFFVIGRNLLNPKLRKIALRALQEGHEIGNHSFSHPHFSEISTDSAVHEIRTSHALIQQLVQEAGVARKRQDLYFRFPFGDCGNTWNSQPVQDTLAQLNYGIARWDLDTNDWRMELRWFPRSSSTVIASLRDTRPEDVVLLHDRPATARHLPQMLNMLGQLQLVSLTLSVIGYGPRVYTAEGGDNLTTDPWNAAPCEASYLGAEDLLDTLLPRELRASESRCVAPRSQVTIGSNLW